jgi:class 3 adenylate cyclase/CHASE2 domain-containing sensor protein
MIRGLVFCGFCAVAIALVSVSAAGQQLERQIGLVLLYTARGDLKPPQGALIVGLDRASIGWLQRNIRDLRKVSRGLDGCLSSHAQEVLSRARNVSQLPRALHACLILRLAERSPSLVVFDINFNAETPDDSVLADALKHAGNVLLLERVEENTAVHRHRPSTPLANAALGTVFFQTDGSPSRVVTGYPTRDPYFPQIPSLPIAAWHHRTGTLDWASPAMPPFRRFWLYGPAGTIPTLSIRSVFDAESSALPADLSGVTVFVGASDPSERTAYDHFKVPILTAGTDMVGGVELAATAFLNLLHGKQLFALPLLARAGVVFSFALAILIASQFLGGRRGFGGVLAIASAYGAAAVAAFALAGLWLPVAVPILIVTPVAVLSAFSARVAVANRVVGRLAPRPFAQELLRHPGIGRRHAQVEDATVMFADMVGSSALAERLGEDAFRTLMNRYYSVATTAVEANEGMVVEYMGDGILALFTAGVAGPDHATKACRAAQAVSDSPLRRTHDADLEASEGFRLRFGLHSGTVITGPTGAEHRYSFKALGDSVIVAARLEEYAKTLRQDSADIILLTADTRRRAGLKSERVDPLGLIMLRGRSSEVEIFRLRAPETRGGVQVE